MTTEEIRSYIELLIDPSRGKSLKDLDAIKYIGINDEKDSIVLIVEIGKKGGQAEEFLKRELARIIKLGLGYSGIKIQFEECKEGEYIAGKDTKFYLISSSKGGVGKSTITINLAYALKNKGYKVGIIDADIYNPSIPILLEITELNANITKDNKISPFKKDDIEIMSSHFFTEPLTPLLWRGESLNTMLENMLYQVDYSKDLDFVLIDMPPSSCDALILLSEKLPAAKVLVVSDDTHLGAISAVKTIKAHMEKEQAILGIILNKNEDKSDACEFILKNSNYEILAKIPYIKDHELLFKNNELEDVANILIIDE